MRIQEAPSPAPSPELEPTPSPSLSPPPTDTAATDIECLLCSDEVTFKFDQVQAQLPSKSLPDKWGYTGKGKLRSPDHVFMEIIFPAEDVATENGAAVISSQNLLEILNGTRSRVVSSDVTEPLGVAIGFDLTLEGFRNRRIDVRWSLFTAGKRAMVNQDWLVNRRALVAIPEATFDRARGEFWIPLPKKRGPFFVRVSAWDQNIRLDSSDSAPFK